LPNAFDRAATHCECGFFSSVSFKYRRIGVNELEHRFNTVFKLLSKIEGLYQTAS
jgi:hypothetical protein